MASLSKYTGTNIGVAELWKAASELQSEYRREHNADLSVAIPWPAGTNGYVTMNLFRATRPQILVAGKAITAEVAASMEMAVRSSTPIGSGKAPAANAGATAKTNAPPGFLVRAYEIHGDTLLNTDQLTRVLEKYTGTNVTVADILKAGSDLQMEYIQRGYATVKVMIPPQAITNGMVKFQILEGKLADVVVRNNRYFSSNNVMRALPSLKTNIVLNSNLLQPELDRANANRDRSIYPEIEPGPGTNTSALVLKIKDRLPLHARLEANNNSTPGTSDLRVSGNISYDNLWQYEHSLGLQYGFSPELMKGADVPGFSTLPLDSPAVTYYGAFYRAPLSQAHTVEEATRNNPVKFGYNEATRRFELPPSAGRSDLSLYATRSTTDTTLLGPIRSLTSQTSSNTQFTLDNQALDRTVTRDVTVGTRLSLPMHDSSHWHASWNLGLDYKDHATISLSTNLNTLTAHSTTENGQPVNKITHFDIFQGASRSAVSYLPFLLGWNLNETDKQGQAAGSFSCIFAPGGLFSDARDFQQAASSSEADGHFAAFRLRLSREHQLFRQWKLNVIGEGQMATQPLVSLEQFGIGGLGSVRGYQEGEIYGDHGWYTQVELTAPPIKPSQTLEGKLVDLSLTLSAFTDYGQIYLIDPQGRDARSDLWGAGFAGSLWFGPQLSGRVAVAWPLLNSPSRSAGTVRVSFGISAQF